MNRVEDEYDATQRLAQVPPKQMEHGNCFGLVLLWDGDSVVGVDRVETSPVLQVEQTIRASKRNAFGLVEHYATLPAPGGRSRHAADMLFTDRRTREFVADAIDAKLNKETACRTQS